jgi:hypothetical protein
MVTEAIELKLRWNNLPELETTCSACHGKRGYSDIEADDGWAECLSCNGTGFIPTPLGTQILTLLSHQCRVDSHLRAFRARSALVSCSSRRCFSRRSTSVFGTDITRVASSRIFSNGLGSGFSDWAGWSMRGAYPWNAKEPACFQGWPRLGLHGSRGRNPTHRHICRSVAAGLLGVNGNRAARVTWRDR